MVILTPIKQIVLQTFHLPISGRTLVALGTELDRHLATANVQTNAWAVSAPLRRHRTPFLALAVGIVVVLVVGVGNKGSFNIIVLGPNNCLTSQITIHLLLLIR